MAIQTFNPSAEITLTKVVQRTGSNRLNTEIREVALTDWLGDNGSVIVHRAINSPAHISINLTDRINSTTEDTLYSLIEPMDAITVRMARQPHRYNQLPVVARALVDSVRRTEVMGSDGKPVRAVVIEATDIIGKSLQRVEIFHKAEYKLGNSLLSQFPLFELGKIGFEALPSGQFVKQVVEIANAWLAGLSIRAGLEDPLHINVDSHLVTKGKVGPFAIQAWQGNLWTFLTNWCDLGWNELLLEDRGDGPWLVFRPKPYRGVDGRPTSLDPAMQNFRPEEIELDAAQVVSMSLSRSDANIANFYNVRCPPGDMIFGNLLDTYYLQNGSTFLGDQHPNSAHSVYGLRKIEETSGQYSDEFLVHPDKLVGSAQKDKQARFMGDWIAWRRDELVRQQRDQVVLEEGNATVQGWETMKPGMNLVLNRGALRASYYLHAVTHEYKPFKSYNCHVQVKRGTGFVERAKMAGSPYFSEGRPGVYGR